VRPRRSTKAKPRNQGGPPARARLTIRNGSTAEADAKEWEHSLGRRRGMGALPRPKLRNGSLAMADAKEWEHRRGRRQGMGAPPRPTPRKGLERMRSPAPRNPQNGGTKRQPTTSKKWSDRKKEYKKKGKHRLVEAAGTRTMTTMKKPNEANKANKAQSGATK
jgi:hypothetical protein